MEKLESNNKLKYLDPDLYIPGTGEKEIESNYVCSICCGVVLDPVECKEC